MLLNSRNRLSHNFRAKGNLSFGLEMFENIFDTTELTPLVSNVTGTQNLWICSSFRRPRSEQHSMMTELGSAVESRSSILSRAIAASPVSIGSFAGRDIHGHRALRRKLHHQPILKKMKKSKKYKIRFFVFFYENVEKSENF